VGRAIWGGLAERKFELSYEFMVGSTAEADRSRRLLVGRLAVGKLGVRWYYMNQKKGLGELLVLWVEEKGFRRTFSSTLSSLSSR